MNIQQSTQQIQAATERATTRYQHACSQPPQPELPASFERDDTSLQESNPVLKVALEELQITLEKLQVAEEELYQQNKALEDAFRLLEAERERYQNLFEFVPDGYLVTDAVGKIQEANRAAALLLNIAPQRLVGKPLSVFVALEARRAFREQLNRLHHDPRSQGAVSLKAQLAARSQEWEVRLQPRQESSLQQLPTSRERPDGALPKWTGMPPLGQQSFDATLTVAAVRDRNGNLVALRWLLRDISDRKRAEAAMQRNELYELALQGSNDGLWDWNLDTNQIHVSHRWKAMLGCEEDEVGQSSDEWFNRVHAEDIERLRSAIADYLGGHTPLFEHEHRMLYQDGTYRWMLSRGTMVLDAGGRPCRIAGSLSDITDRRLAKERLLHDALTGLPNRVMFMQRLTQVAEQAKLPTPAEPEFAVLFLDIDCFKAVNDSLGHLVGDQLLIAIARRLKTCLRLEDTVARLGGDEFAILLQGVKAAEDAIEVAERIQVALTPPFRLSTRVAGDRGDYEVFASASIGIALGGALEADSKQAPSPLSRVLPEDLLHCADMTMYRAKTLGRGRYEVFNRDAYPSAVTYRDTLQVVEADLP